MPPVYDLECTKCGTQREVFRFLANIEDKELCCELPMNRIMTNGIPFTKFDMQRRASVKRVMKKKLESERKK